MTPLEMIIEFGKLSVQTQDNDKYAYVRIRISSLDYSEAHKLVETFPDSSCREYDVKLEPDLCWRWTSNGIAGLEQVIRSFRKSELFQEPFIRCMMIYLWCHVSKRSIIAKRIDKMLGHRAIRIQEVLICTPKTFQ